MGGNVISESIDIVVVANCKNQYLWEMTQNAIRTARRSPGFPIGEVIVVEQNRTQNVMPGADKLLHYSVPFNYNWCLNLGYSFTQSKYVAFCNNDLNFQDKWAKNAIRAMKEHNYLSVCPSNKRHDFKGVIEGYKVGLHILGWCIIVNREIFEYIEQFDMPVSFWYSDNVYAVQLICAGIKHVLVGDSRVRHLKSQTLTKIKGNQRSEYMKRQEKFFNQYKVKKYATASLKIQAETSHSD